MYPWSRGLGLPTVPSQEERKRKRKLVKRTVEKTVDRGTSEDETEELDGRMRHSGKVTRILHLLFIHPTSFFFTGSSLGMGEQMEALELGSPTSHSLPSDLPKHGQGHG